MNATRQPKRAARLKHPVKAAKAKATALFAAHPFWSMFLTAAATAGMCVLLVWFLVFSGFNSPVQFIYAGF